MARLGIDDLAALDSPAAVREYEDARMSAEWAFSELGQARAALPDGKGRLDGWAVFRLEDELDLDAVADAMVEAGYTERVLDGRRHLTAPAPGRCWTSSTARGGRWRTTAS